MAVYRASLSLDQGDTFRFEFAATIDGASDAAEVVATSPSLELHYLENGNPRKHIVHVAHAALIGNTVRLTVTKEATAALGGQNGRWNAHVQYGSDRVMVGTGNWVCVRTAAPAPGLELAYENPDGPAYDAVALYDATASPASKRVYVAQGRVRSSLRISDYQRMPREDVRFRASGLAHNETVIALAIDSVNSRLWTATEEGAVYVESIANQAAPVQAATPLVLSLALGQSVVDLAVWGGVGEEVAVLLTSTRLYTLRIVAGAIVQAGQSELVGGSSPMSDTNVVPDDSITQIRVIGLERVEVNKDSDGRIVAYVRANCLGYESLPLDRPFPRLIVLCDLDLAGAFAAPKFKQDTGVFTYHVFYNPFPVHPINYPAPGLGWPNGIPAGAVKTDYDVTGMEAITFGGAQMLYVSHGRRNQVRILDVSHAFTAGIVVGASIACHPNFPGDPANAMDISTLRVDPNDADRFIVLERDNEGARIVDAGAGTFPLLADYHFAEGPIRGMPVVAISGKPFTVWVFSFGACAYNFAVLDASGAAIAVLHGGYWYMNIDGVRRGRGREIWTLTFGGVIRYDRNGDDGEWFPAADSFSPSQVVDPVLAPALLFAPTEYLEFAESIGGVDRLFTSTGIGGFMEFKIDSATRNAGAARFWPHPNAYSTLPSMPAWENLGLGTFYANELAHVQLGGEHFVLFEMTNRAAGEFGLFCYRYLAGSDTWQSFSIVTWGKSLGYAPYTIPLAQNVSVQLINGSWYCTVCAPPGVAIILLDPLARLHPMQLVRFYDFRSLISASPATFTNGCNAMCLTPGHMIVTTYEPTATKLWAFPLDARGVPTSSPVQTITAASLGLVAPQSWDRTFYARFVDLGNRRGAIYLATASATLLEFEYRQDSSTPVRFVSSMQSDYKRVCADLHVTDVGDGPCILLGNNTEGFAIAAPSLK